MTPARTARIPLHHNGNCEERELPVKLQCKLYVASGKRRRDLAEQGAGQRRNRIGEVRMIESVKELRAELQADRFLQPEVLHRSQVELLERRTRQRVSR